MMRIRLLVIAVAGLSFAGTSVASEPPKAPVRTADAAAEQTAPVVIAAADEIRTPAAADREAAAPAKRERKARVTTCRCGDQTPNN